MIWPHLHVRAFAAATGSRGVTGKDTSGDGSPAASAAFGASKAAPSPLASEYLVDSFRGSLAEGHLLSASTGSSRNFPGRRDGAQEA